VSPALNQMPYPACLGPPFSLWLLVQPPLVCTTRAGAGADSVSALIASTSSAMERWESAVPGAGGRHEN
jgi:hypothetical protein